MINSLPTVGIFVGILTQNPLAAQISNTQHQVKDIVSLMDEERTFVGDGSSVNFYRDDVVVNLQPGSNFTQSDDTLIEISMPPASYLSEDFESADWANRYSVLNATRERGVAARTGSYGMRIKVSKGSHWGGHIKFDHSRHGQGGNFEEIWTRYYVRFGPNWRRNDKRIGKAGYRAMSKEVCNAPCLEMTDSHELSGSGSIAGYSYFHRDISDANLRNRTFQHSRRNWSGGSAAHREREQWYCVETHHVLNTPGQSNGIYQNWLEGTLVSDQRDIRQRDSATFNIDSSVLITYIGGSWVADRDMNIYFDDWAVSDKRIGCL